MRKLAALFGSVLLFFPNIVFAHGIGQVYALPVPLEYYLAGAGIAVAVSFFVLAVFLKKTDQSIANRVISAPWLNLVIKGARIISVALLLLTIAAAIFGNQLSTGNFASIFFWVYFLIGMGVLSLVVGNIWDKVNPWKIISAWGSSDMRPAARNISGLVGVVFILALFWFELVSQVSFVPRILGIVLTIYTLLNLVMNWLCANWYKDGELFSVLFGFIGTIAHLRISEDNSSFIVVNKTQQLVGIAASWWTLGVASVLLAGASFDSLKESVLWYKWLAALGLPTVSIPAETVGLVLAPIPFLLAYLFACWIMKQLVGKEYNTLTLAQQFVWSLVPIAFGYTLAHNFSLFIVMAPRLLTVISDPFGLGWNLVSTADYQYTELLLGAKVVWFIEIGFVILAHIFGVWYAHILALNIFKDPKQALKSQYPMVILMIGFTVLTLWLLSQPLVVVQ